MSWFADNVEVIALHAAVSAVTGGLVAAAVVAPLRNVVRNLTHRISAAMDSLDPDVPVGLTKQLDDMDTKLQTLNRQMDGTLKVRTVDHVHR